MVLSPDLAPLPFKLLLHFNHSTLALSHRAFQNLILLVDRFDLGLVFINLLLHVTDPALQIPRLPSRRPTSTCPQQQILSISFSFRTLQNKPFIE